MKFNYQARTTDGDIQVGQIEASSRKAAITVFQKQGIYITFLEEATPPLYAKRIEIFKGISGREIVLFSRQLSILFKSKVPLVESLRVLSFQHKNLDFKDKIIKLSEEVEAGTAFSKALVLYPDIFSSFYISMVKSGEISGKLSEVLNYLADHLEREYHLMSKVKGAFIYPSLIMFVVIAVLALMVFFVIPQLAGVLEGGGQELPLITKIIIVSASFIREWGWLMILVFAILTFFSFRYYMSPRGKKFFDNIFLKIPIVGPLLKMVYLARFAENLSTLISGGLPITKALETTADVIDNNMYKSAILEARDGVRKGEPISSILVKFPSIFPPMFVQMALVGEKTGSLDTSLLNMNEFYRKEIDRAIDNALSILEPVLILVLGLIVTGVMLSILMPLYKMITI